jgi:DNA-binding PadR family transcriptional regulator
MTYKMRGWLFFEDFVRLHVLHHATKKPICVGEVVTILNRHGYRLNPRAIRPVLQAMEQAGYLAGFSVVVDGKRRRYYEATAEGRQVMEVATPRLRELATELLPEPPGFQ